MNQTQLKDNIFEKVADLNIPNIGEEYPYFGTAHFFALKETALSDDNYNTIAAKTSLFFKNSFYLNHLLNKNKTDNEGISEPIFLANEEKESKIEQKIQNENSAIISPETKVESILIEDNIIKSSTGPSFSSASPFSTWSMVRRKREPTGITKVIMNPVGSS